MSGYFNQALVLLAAAVLLLPLFQRLGLGSILGYLAAGILIGPLGFGLIPDAEAVLHFAELGVVLMFHTGWEHSCKVVSQKFTDPLKLERPLDHGGPVIAAHCGSCAWYDKEQYYPRFVEMMNRYDNLFGDTAIMASMNRWFSLRRMSREEEWLKRRILHGSDYPFPTARLPFLFRTGLFPSERKNPLDLDLRVKRSFKFGPGYAGQVLKLLGVEPSSPVPQPPLSTPGARE